MHPVGASRRRGTCAPSPRRRKVGGGDADERGHGSVRRSLALLGHHGSTTRSQTWRAPFARGTSPNTRSGQFAVSVVRPTTGSGDQRQVSIDDCPRYISFIGVRTRRAAVIVFGRTPPSSCLHTSWTSLNTEPGHSSALGESASCSRGARPAVPGGDAPRRAYPLRSVPCDLARASSAQA